MVLTPRGCWAFVPEKLPPPLEYDPALVFLLDEASRALARLAGLGERLPNPRLLIAPYLRREAVLSSRIEGTQTSLSDLFLFEAARSQPANGSDVKEVLNYVLALEHGLRRIKELPLSLRLVREIHGKLLEGVRGQEKQPGSFRTIQNYIGPPGCKEEEATYVPPPVTELHRLLDKWEKFLHDDSGIPPLIQCGILHYWFEAIHPFFDGNGRVGRLLIILFLCAREHLSQPQLYLSAFFEKHRGEYYDRLLAFSRDGDWKNWLLFFLRGVAEQSKDAVERMQRMLSLQEKYRNRLDEAKANANVLRLLDQLFRNPYTNIPRAAKQLRVSYLTAQAAISFLGRQGIVQEVTGKKRYRIFCARELLRTIEVDLTT